MPQVLFLWRTALKSCELCSGCKSLKKNKEQQHASKQKGHPQKKGTLTKLNSTEMAMLTGCCFAWLCSMTELIWRPCLQNESPTIHHPHRAENTMVQYIPTGYAIVSCKRWCIDTSRHFPAPQASSTSS